MDYFDSHPNLDSVELFILGRLEPDETMEMEDHLLVCGRCRLMAEALENQIQVIQEALTTDSEFATSLARRS